MPTFCRALMRWATSPPWRVWASLPKALRQAYESGVNSVARQPKGLCALPYSSGKQSLRTNSHHAYQW